MIRISNGVPIAHRQTNHRTATPVSINELLWVREFLHQLKQMGQAKNVHEGRTIANPVQQSQTIIEIRPCSVFDFVEGWVRGSRTVVTKKDVNLADSIRFNRQ